MAKLRRSVRRVLQSPADRSWHSRHATHANTEPAEKAVHGGGSRSVGRRAFRLVDAMQRGAEFRLCSWIPVVAVIASLAAGHFEASLARDLPVHQARRSLSRRIADSMFCTNDLMEVAFPRF